MSWRMSHIFQFCGMVWVEMGCFVLKSLVVFTSWVIFPKLFFVGRFLIICTSSLIEKDYSGYLFFFWVSFDKLFLSSYLAILSKLFKFIGIKIFITFPIILYITVQLVLISAFLILIFCVFIFFFHHLSG